MQTLAVAHEVAVHTPASFTQFRFTVTEYLLERGTDVTKIYGYRVCMHCCFPGKGDLYESLTGMVVGSAFRLAGTGALVSTALEHGRAP